MCSCGRALGQPRGPAPPGPILTELGPIQKFSC